MRARSCLFLVLLVAAVVGCRAPLPDPPLRPSGDAGADSAARVLLEPDADPAAAPRVLRVTLALPQGSRASASALALYRGTLDDYHLRRIEKDDLPKTLLERRVPSMAWAERDGGVLVLAPSVPLAAGGVYSVASPDLGLVTTLRVREAGTAPLLARVWPPPDAGSGASYSIYCADGGAPTAGQGVLLSPGQVSARLEPGVGVAGRGACVHLAPAELPDGGRFVPPPRVGGVALNPAPLENASTAALELPDCGAGEVRFGPGCAEPQDDRVVVRAPDAPLFWSVVSGGSMTLHPSDAGARFVVRGLEPSSTWAFDVTTVDLGGRERHSSVQLPAAPVTPHVVINEVLANPLGPEPTEEWVELVNDGSTAVGLAGWVLSDVGGSTTLPAHWLQPGAFALVVRDDFVPDDGLDPAPEPGVALLRVPSIGSHGLSNAGEPLKLVDPSGQVRSRFPAVPKPRAGISVARRHPWSLDDDSRSFGLSGGKGASPGGPNRLDE